MGVESA